MELNEVHWLERRLEELSERIAAVEARLESADSKLRETYGHELGHLWEQRRAAENHVTALKRREAESWEREDLQAGIFNIFDDIGRRIDRIISRVP